MIYVATYYETVGELDCSEAVGAFSTREKAEAALKAYAAAKGIQYEPDGHFEIVNFTLDYVEFAL